MFENQNKYQDYLSLALLKLLNENTFYDIKPETIIKKSQIKIPDDFIWLADNKIKLLKSKKLLPTKNSSMKRKCSYIVELYHMAHMM